MARPQGEIRQALAGAAERLLVAGDWLCDGVAMSGVPWRAIAAEAQVGWDVARDTVNNMVRSGELLRVGRGKPEGAERWHSLYAPRHLVDRNVVTGIADDWPSPWAGIEDLARAVAPVNQAD